MSCVPCTRYMHERCRQINNDGQCCCLYNTDELVESNDESEDDDDEDWRKNSSRRSGRGTGKRDETLRDQQSTGRKRAAVKYPLDRDASCEWSGLRFAGGGNFPIVGCIDGLQQARHHGPDKNTLNNDQGNVHRICHTCHNRWHSRNDETYKWGGIYRSHDSNTKASAAQQWEAEQSWLGKKLVKVSD